MPRQTRVPYGCASLKSAEQLRVFCPPKKRAEMMAHCPIFGRNLLIRRSFLHERHELVEVL